MARTFRLLLLLAVLEAMLPVLPAVAQTPKDAPATTDPLPDLPHPLDVPRSLLAPAPAPGSPPAPPEQPYFEQDPLLDPVQLPQPGWFAAAQIQLGVPHFKDRLQELVAIGGNPPTLIHAPGADLDWTVVPRFEVGYRLGSGFGEFAVAFRFLDTSGTGSGLGRDGPANLHSRLDFNMMDFDYASREFSLWPHCDMKWRFGLRSTYLYYDAQAEEPFAEAAAGSGLLEQRNTDRYIGFGPHVGLELARHFEDSGLALVGKIDGAVLLGSISQNYLAESTSAGFGQVHDSGSQNVDILTVDAGVSWQPPCWKQLQLFAGYEYEYWWNAGRFSAGTARGELSDQGLLLRASFNY